MVINVCRVVDPEVIIFGGGLSKAGQPLLEVIKKHVTQRTWKLPTDVKLTLALTDNNGVVGAALAAKSDMLGALVTRGPAIGAVVPTSTSSGKTPSTATAATPGAVTAVVKSGNNDRQRARRSPASSSALLSPTTVAAFFSMSSSALLFLHLLPPPAISSRDNATSGNELQRWLVPALTRGLMLGQVGVGALAVYHWMRDSCQ